VAVPAFLSTVLPLWKEAIEATARPRGWTRALLLRSLWGNRADLSLTGGKVHSDAAAGDAGDTSHDALLLVDDSTAASADVEALLGGSAPHSIGIVLDNCGLELLTDLAWADALLTAGGPSFSVTLWVKPAPIFVSDAMAKDVHSHVAAMASMTSADATALARSLQAHLSSRRLRLCTHPFFNGPDALWDAPSSLVEALRAHDLVVFKGDANYRRLLGDRHWVHEAPFASVVHRVTSRGGPTVVALRTCKAGLICGLSAAKEAEAAARHPADWLTSGMYGVVQRTPGTD
jgi:hypothetical protein